MDGLLDGKTVGYGTGGIGFMMLAIFLVVLFVLFRRGEGGYGEGGIGNLLPLGAAMLERRNDSPADQIAINRQANFVDPEIAQLLKDQAVDTGRIEHDIDQQTCQLQRSLDQQSCELEKSISRVVQNQDRNALDAERLFNQRYIDDQREKMAELRLHLAEKEARILHQETICAIGRSNGELNGRLDHIAGHVEHRLTRMEDHMLKKPPFFAAGGVPFVSPCVPSGVPFRGGFDGCHGVA